MHLGVRVAPVRIVDLWPARALSPCGNPPTKNAIRNIFPTNTAPTTTAPPTSTSATSSTTNATLEPPQTVLTQDRTAGPVLDPGAPVALTMHACPR